MKGMLLRQLGMLKMYLTGEAGIAYKARKRLNQRASDREKAERIKWLKENFPLEAEWEE